MFDFAGFANAFSATMGGPFHAATVHYPGTPVVDTGGSIISPGTPIEQACMCQRDVCTEQMRTDTDFQERDVRLLITGLEALTTEASVIILSGPHVGTYALRSATRDPAAFGWECRARGA